MQKKTESLGMTHSILLKRLAVIALVLIGAGLATAGGLSSLYFAAGLTPLAFFAVSRNFIVNTAWPIVSNYAVDLFAKAVYYSQVVFFRIVSAAQDFSVLAKVIAQNFSSKFSELFSILVTNIIPVVTNLWVRLSAAGTNAMNYLTSTVSSLSLKTKITASIIAGVTGLIAFVGGVFAYSKITIENAKPKRVVPEGDSNSNNMPASVINNGYPPAPAASTIIKNTATDTSLSVAQDENAEPAVSKKLSR